MKGPFALELIPKLPNKPPAEEEGHDPGFSFGGEAFTAPANPRVRPNIMRWAGNRGVGALVWAPVALHVLQQQNKQCAAAGCCLQV
jgi:hypothetical protein